MLSSRLKLVRLPVNTLMMKSDEVSSTKFVHDKNDFCSVNNDVLTACFSPWVWFCDTIWQYDVDSD